LIYSEISGFVDGNDLKIAKAKKTAFGDVAPGGNNAG
jgi:hypothetical protein